jgi:hypothetical protein
LPENTVKLYELSSALRQIMEQVTLQDGEITEDQERILDALNASFPGKVESVLMVRQEIEATAVGVKMEIERLSRKARSLAAASERLKGYVRSQMQLAGRESVETPLFNVRIQRSSPSARWTMLDSMIPAEFRRVVPERVEFNAVAALKAASAGRALPEGIEIVQGSHIVIR